MDIINVDVKLDRDDLNTLQEIIGVAIGHLSLTDNQTIEYWENYQITQKYML